MATLNELIKKHIMVGHNNVDRYWYKIDPKAMVSDPVGYWPSDEDPEVEVNVGISGEQKTHLAKCQICDHVMESWHDLESLIFEHIDNHVQARDIPEEE